MANFTDSPRLGNHFTSALYFAANAHSHQIRKDGGTPYISHLMAVASLVLEAGGSEDEAIAALLHDAVEDAGVSLATIEEKYGKHVAYIVAGCTESEEQPKPPWKERKLRYVGQIEESSTSVVLVSLADKLHNARCYLKEAREQSLVFDRETQQRTLWFYDCLTAVYALRLPECYLLQELRLCVRELNSLWGDSDHCDPDDGNGPFEYWRMQQNG